MLLRLTEVVTQGCSVKKLFLKISENSQENTCTRVSFLIKLQTFSYRTPPVAAIGLNRVDPFIPRSMYWKFSLTNFCPVLPFYTSETLLVFSGGIKWMHDAETGYYFFHLILQYLSQFIQPMWNDLRKLDSSCCRNTLLWSGNEVMKDTWSCVIKSNTCY